MNSQEIIDRVFKAIDDNESPKKYMILAIEAAKETLKELIREDNADDFYECGTCGCLITNDMEHQHKDGWFGS